MLGHRGVPVGSTPLVRVIILGPSRLSPGGALRAPQCGVTGPYGPPSVVCTPGGVSPAGPTPLRDQLICKNAKFVSTKKTNRSPARRDPIYFLFRNLSPHRIPARNNSVVPLDIRPDASVICCEIA